MANRPRIGVFISHANEVVGADLAGLADVVRELERTGVDYVSVADHVVLGPSLEAHAALGGAALGYPLDEPYPDPLVTLAYVAALTKRVRLMTGVLVAPLRNPVVLAKSVATLAVLAGGRLDLGLGTGWQQAEYDAIGVDVAAKVTRLDTAVAVCRELWRTAPASFDSPDVHFDGLHCFPQPPGGTVPLWFAGRPVPGTLRRIVRWGMGWLPITQLTPDDARAARRALDEACLAAGRDAGEVGIRCAVGVPIGPDGDVDFERLTEHVAALHAAGVDGVHLPLSQLTGTGGDLARAVAVLAALCDNAAAA